MASPGFEPPFDPPRFQPPPGQGFYGGPPPGGGPLGPPGTVLFQLRVMMAAIIAAPVVIWLPLVLAVPGGSGSFPVAIAVLVIVVAALPAILVGPRVPRPLTAVPGPPGRPATRVVNALRQALMLRFALSEAVILVGVALSFASNGLLPYAVAFVVGWPLLVWLAWPRTSLIESMRRRLEAGGVPSDLWPALLGPVGNPPPYTKGPGR